MFVTVAPKHKQSEWVTGFAAAGIERSPVAVPSQQHATSQPTLEVEVRKVEGLLKAVAGAEGIFMHLFGSQGAQDTFWLDR